MANDKDTGQVSRPQKVDPARELNRKAAIRAEHSIENARGGGYGPVGGVSQKKGNPPGTTHNTQQPKGGKRGK